MRGDQLARQRSILRTIESKKQGTTVADLAVQEDCSTRTTLRHLPATQNTKLPLPLQFITTHDSQYQHKAKPTTRELQREMHAIMTQVGEVVDVMSWVMGFDRHAEVLEPEHLREAVSQELAAMVERYAEGPSAVYEEDFGRGNHNSL